MTNLKRVSVLSLVLTILAVFLTVQSALAVGTASNTTISNTASISFSVGGVGQTPISSAPASFVVDNVVNLNVVSNGDRTITPGELNIALPFTLTNTGNTTQGYSLTVSDVATNIPLNNVRIFLDEGSVVGQYDAGDTSYTLGTNIKDLNPNGVIGTDDVVRIIIVADANGITAASGLTDTYLLTATTLDAGTTNPTTENLTPNTDGLEVVFADLADGTRNGQDSASGIYTLTSAALTITKSSAVISDPINLSTNPKAIPGAIVEYTITVQNLATNGATATASAITVSDDLSTEIGNGTILFASDGYAAGRGIRVTAPNLYGGVQTDLTNVAGDEGLYSGNVVSVNSIELAIDETATVQFRVEIQ